jgi:hypothetical protein
LFVDFENVFFALLNGVYLLKRERALSVSMDGLSELRRRLRLDGIGLVLERCYADWEQLPAPAQRQLQIAGILPRFTDSRPDKSTADIELSLDILNAVLTRQELDHVILVGGDRDYLPILRRLKEADRGITVCSLRHCLSGDVREFVDNSPKARILELDSIMGVAPPVPTPAETAETTKPLSSSPRQSAPLSRRDIEPNEWHERYLTSMLRFIRERNFREIHLGPFIRWLQAEKVFELVSGNEQRKILDELQAMGAVRVEERDTGQGYSFSSACLNWNDPLVRRLNDVAE